MKNEMENVMKEDMVPLVINAGQSLVDNIELMAHLKERMDVVNKVREMIQISGLNMMTTQQVADYYNVKLSAIQRCYLRNKDEIDEDGVACHDVSDFLMRQDIPVKNIHGKKLLDYGDYILEIPKHGIITLFSKRAVLRIGMLLGNSKIAEEVRNLPLNTFKLLTPEQKIKDIETEKSICTEIGTAIMSGDTVGLKMWMTMLSAFKNRHADSLKKKIEDITEGNNVLTENIADKSLEISYYDESDPY